MRNIRIHGFCALVALLLSATAAHSQVTVLYNFGSKSGDPLQPSYSGIVAQGRDEACTAHLLGAELEAAEPCTR